MSERERFEEWARLQYQLRDVDTIIWNDTSPAILYNGALRQPDEIQRDWITWQAALATPPAGVCVAVGVYNDSVGSVYDGHGTTVAHLGLRNDALPALDGHRVRVWVEDLGGREGLSDHISFPFYRDTKGEGLSLLTTEVPFFCPRNEPATRHPSLYVHVETVYGAGCMMREAYDQAPLDLFVNGTKP